ncbi:MAG: hypothetical protein IPG67_17210 [Acidobacteria bacterium]|nr:hypothetical protein [Acidobacteriota bacterium]
MPVCSLLIATAGTTNAGIIDDLAGIATICDQRRSGFTLMPPTVAGIGGSVSAASFNGIEEADSVTIDPHKWLFSPYDCGAIIYQIGTRKRPTPRKVPTSIFSAMKVTGDLIRRTIRYN